MDKETQRLIEGGSNDFTISDLSRILERNNFIRRSSGAQEKHIIYVHSSGLMVRLPHALKTVKPVLSEVRFAVRKVVQSKEVAAPKKGDSTPDAQRWICLVKRLP